MATKIGRRVEDVVYTVNPTVVTYATRSDGRPARNQRQLEMEIAALAMNIGDAIATIDRSRKTFVNQTRIDTSTLLRMALAENTPLKYTTAIASALGESVEARARQIEDAIRCGSIMPGDALWLRANFATHPNAAPLPDMTNFGSRRAVLYESASSRLREVSSDPSLSSQSRSLE